MLPSCILTSVLNCIPVEDKETHICCSPGCFQTFDDYSDYQEHNIKVHSSIIPAENDTATKESTCHGLSASPPSEISASKLSSVAGNLSADRSMVLEERVDSTEGQRAGVPDDVEVGLASVPISQKSLQGGGKPQLVCMPVPVTPPVSRKRHRPTERSTRTYVCPVSGCDKQFSQV